MATRRRVRGWSRLVTAAARGPFSYEWWINHGELRAFAAFRRRQELRDEQRNIVVLLLDDRAIVPSVRNSLASLRRALPDPLIYSIATEGEGVRALRGYDSLKAALMALADRHTSGWLLPLVAGDEVSVQLGDILARAIGTGEERLVYWDEDVVATGRRRNPWVKPDWDPLLFGTLGGLLGASVVSLAALRDCLRSVAEEPIAAGALAELLFHLACSRRPKHVPLILTHRHCRSVTRPSPRSCTAAPRRWPNVSIIVPTRDKPRLLRACVRGIDQTDYAGSVQTVVVDNGSQDRAAVRLLEELENNPRFTVLRDDGEFNFPRLNNLAASSAEGEVLCLLNNDVEPLDRDWLTTLVSYVVDEDVGAVGAQLLYPTGRIQHAGVAVGVGGAAGHIQKGVWPDEPSFWTWHAVTREVSAVTAAVLVVKKRTFEEVGGLDERFPVAFNDVDFCLRLKLNGLRNIYVAEVRLLHRESESRGKDCTPAQARRFAGELARLQDRWDTESYVDPYFSPLFCALVERCVLNP